MLNKQSGGNERRTLGALLKAARATAGLSLRDVEKATKGRLSNGHLSLLESDEIKQPSPHHLFLLSSALNLDYADLLRRAGYVVPGEVHGGIGDPEQAALLSKIMDFTDAEREELGNYIEYLRSKRRSGG